MVTLRRFSLMLGVVLLGAVFGCSSEDASRDTASADAAIDDVSQDTGLAPLQDVSGDADNTDTASEPDTNTAADSGGDDDDVEEDVGCELCGETSLAAEFERGTETLDVAYYGIEHNPDAPSGTSLHIEVYSDAAPGCPTQDSPTPAQTVIITGIDSGIGVEDRLVYGEDWSGSLLDFGGTLLDGSPVARPSSGELIVAGLNICVGCLGQPAPSDPEGWLVANINVSFAEGSVIGAITATHCDSLDVPPP